MSLLDLVLLAVLASDPGPLPQNPPAALGHWTGAIDRDGSLLPISIDVTAGAEGLGSTVDVPSWGQVAQPARASFEDGRLAIPFAGALLDLELDEANGSLRGFLTRRRNEPSDLRVELLRTLAPALPPITIEEVRFESPDGTSLAGSLFLPATDDACPGIVFVQGRSYGDRRGFRSHALLAARRGMAAICFDGRGSGGSGGVRGQHTLEQRLGDAEAALARLRAHPRVDAEKVGMLGHSAGGWIVPVVAQRVDDLAFVVLHSGPAGSLAEQQGQVVRELAKLSGQGFSADELDATYRYQRDLAQLWIDDAPWSAVQAHVAAAQDQPWAAFVDLPESPDNPELSYYRRNPHDSREALRSLDIPLLALYGGADFVVPPEFNVPALEGYLAEAEHEDHHIVVFPDADHGIFRPTVDEPGKPYRWRRRPPGYYEALFDWIAELDL